ncbi:MAG: L-rhamnose mutarotase [Oligoflexus sp.]|nr:L-rhamnose mutarotase [Pseudopedobacter sp.]
MKIAFKMKLLPGMREAYEKRHSEIWPELKNLLMESGISDYSIFLDEETNILFAVQQQNGQSSQDLSSHPMVQKWWAIMKDLMETNLDNSPISKELQMVFHMD